MSEKIWIFSDSTCDITHEEAERWNIGIVPLRINVGDQTYREFYEITPEEYWDILEREEELPTTTQVAMESFEEQYRKAKEAGCTHCIGLLINGKGSGTYQTSCIVRDMFYEENGTDMKIELIDSEKYAYLYGSVIIEAAKLRDAGASFEEIVADIKDRLSRIRAYLGVYNLKHLRKSGRISGGAAFVGDALGMKPVLLVDNASVDVVMKVRGDKNLIPKLVELAIKEAENPQEQTAFLLHAKVSEERLADTEARLLEAGFGKVLRHPLGMAVTTNIGPLAIAIGFYRRSDA
jgi:DegV family protein with EDD domain